MQIPYLGGTRQTNQLFLGFMVNPLEILGLGGKATRYVKDTRQSNHLVGRIAATKLAVLRLRGKQKQLVGYTEYK